MSKFSSLAAYALMAPAITLGIGSALATEQRTYEQPTAQEQRQMPEQSQKDKGMSTADRAQEQRMGAERATQHKNLDTNLDKTYLSSAPSNSYGADKLIGADLKSRSDNESIGEISDLVIDKDGQIAAVIVEVGGFLGLGEKEVAISWDSIERSSNENDDDYEFTVDTTKDALENAPAYKTASKQY